MLHDLFPGAIPGQKCHMNMSLISMVMEMWVFEMKPDLEIIHLFTG